MKTTHLSLLIPFALLGTACGSPTSRSEPIGFVHTVSFGFCFPSSYCISRLELSPREAVLTYQSDQRATIVQRRLDVAMWTRAVDALDASGLRALPEVVGCPNCVDGGTESLRVAFGDGQADGITFEAGADVPGIEAVVDVLREIQLSFPPPPGGPPPTSEVH